MFSQFITGLTLSFWVGFCLWYEANQLGLVNQSPIPTMTAEQLEDEEAIKMVEELIKRGKKK